jgi:type I restriction enzyme M protein
VLMPGQERVLLTREVIVLRPGPKANFDAFFLLWALTLKIVRDQWKRIVFMQTNREDVGSRYLEILLPIPDTSDRALAVSQPFRDYYTRLAQARDGLAKYLSSTRDHHFFVAGAEELDDFESAGSSTEQNAAAEPE